MLLRNTLLACPLCSRHVFPTDPDCPGCGERLRRADGSIAQTPTAMMMGLGAVFGLVAGGCSSIPGSTEGAGGDGGAADAVATGVNGTSKATTATYYPMMSVSSYGSGVTMSTGFPDECDDGTPGSLDTIVCNDCAECALAGSCSDELAAYAAHPDAQSFDQCIGACSSQACIDGCAAGHPAGAELYSAVLACIVCVECPNNCDATNCM